MDGLDNIAVRIDKCYHLEKKNRMKFKKNITIDCLLQLLALFLLYK